MTNPTLTHTAADYLRLANDHRDAATFADSGGWRSIHDEEMCENFAQKAADFGAHYWHFSYTTESGEPLAWTGDANSSFAQHLVTQTAPGVFTLFENDAFENMGQEFQEIAVFGSVLDAICSVTPTPENALVALQNWRVDETFYANRGVVIVDETGQEIADVCVIYADRENADRTRGTDETNVDGSDMEPRDFAAKRARLMAAAPRLLAALKIMTNHERQHDLSDLRIGRALIAEIENREL